MALSLLAGMALMGALNKFVSPHREFTVQSISGPFLLGHVGYLMRAADIESTEDAEAAPHEQLHKELAAAAAQSREQVAAAEGFHARWQASTVATARLLWLFMDTIDPGAHRETAPGGPARYRAINAAAMPMAWATIKNHPRAYAELVATHYAAFWRYSILSDGADLPSAIPWHYGYSGRMLRNPGNQELMERYMATDYLFDEASRARLQAAARDATPIGRCWAFVVRNRMAALSALALLFPLSFALLLSPRHRRCRLAQLCFCLAFAMHAYAWLGSAVHTAIHRYTLPLLPLLILFLVSMTLILWRWAAPEIARCMAALRTAQALRTMRTVWTAQAVRAVRAARITKRLATYRRLGQYGGS